MFLKSDQLHPFEDGLVEANPETHEKQPTPEFQKLPASKVKDIVLEGIEAGLFKDNLYTFNETAENFDNYDNIAVIEISNIIGNKIAESESSFFDLSEEIFENARDSYDLVIVYKSDSEDYTVSSNSSELTSEVIEYIDSHREPGVDAHEFLDANAEGINSIVTQYTGVQTETITSTVADESVKNSRANIGTIAVTGGSILLVGVIVAALFTNFYDPYGKRNEKRGMDNEVRPLEEGILKASHKFNPKLSQMENDIKELEELALAHRYVNGGLGDEISTYVNLLQELDERMINSGDDPKVFAVPRLEIQELNKTITHALGKNYYLNICENPKFWSQPEGRKAETKDALIKIQKLTLKLIQDVNAKQDLNIRTSLEIINNKNDSEFNNLTSNF